MEFQEKKLSIFTNLYILAQCTQQCGGVVHSSCRYSSRTQKLTQLSESAQNQSGELRTEKKVCVCVSDVSQDGLYSRPTAVRAGLAS